MRASAGQRRRLAIMVKHRGSVVAAVEEVAELLVCVEEFYRFWNWYGILS